MQRYPKHISQVLKRWLPGWLHGPVRYFGLRLLALNESIKDRSMPFELGLVPLPPPLLRYRVHGSLDRDSFLCVGRTCVEDLKNSLRLIGRDLYSFQNVLDFGSGVGRVLRHFYDHPPSFQVYGTDVDAQAIAWGRRKLPFVTFLVNDPLPPLPFAAGTFDLIYAVSVFTHLDEAHQLAWLKELKRVSKPGAILLLSTHGRFAQLGASQQGSLSPEDAEALQTKGLLFKVLERGRFKLDGLPDFYQCTFHRKEYVLEVWSQFFTVKHYIERGINNYQDLVILSVE